MNFHFEISNPMAFWIFGIVSKLGFLEAIKNILKVNIQSGFTFLIGESHPNREEII
jgi:hypothetical protein